MTTLLSMLKGPAPAPAPVTPVGAIFYPVMGPNILTTKAAPLASQVAAASTRAFSLASSTSSASALPAMPTAVSIVSSRVVGSKPARALPALPAGDSVVSPKVAESKTTRALPAFPKPARAFPADPKVSPTAVNETTAVVDTNPLGAVSRYVLDTALRAQTVRARNIGMPAVG